MMRSKTAIAYIGLGSNIGGERSRMRVLEEAVEQLDRWRGCRVTACSRVYRSKPWGYEVQADFLNAACEVATTLPPDRLLAACKAIEERLGRRPTFHWGPRVIDLDILLIQNGAVATPELTVPHRHLLERAFAYLPLLDIAPFAAMPDGTLLRHLVRPDAVTSPPVPVALLQQKSGSLP